MFFERAFAELNAGREEIILPEDTVMIGGFFDFRYCGRTGLWDGGLSVPEERGNGYTGWCTVGGSVGAGRRDLLRVRWMPEAGRPERTAGGETGFGG